MRLLVMTGSNVCPIILCFQCDMSMEPLRPGNGGHTASIRRQPLTGVENEF